MSRITISLGLISLCLVVLGLTGCGGGGGGKTSPLEPPVPRQRPAAVGSALVLYDESGPYGYQGELFAKEMANLLGHFNFAAELQPVEQYVSGDAAAHDCVFYIGHSFDNPLPSGFLADVLTYDKPVCWMGYNIWQYTGDAGAQFTAQFGMTYDRLDNADAASIDIEYNGFTLPQDPSYPDVTVMQVTDPGTCETVATCTKNGVTFPYLLHAGSFWFAGSIPFANAGYGDKYFAFADVLHDILGINHTAQRQAFLRIEDVSPNSEPDNLRAIADVCANRGIPFAISVIPVYRDPMLEEGDDPEVTYAERPEVAEAIRYMVSKGGQIVQHGYTHQYGDYPNPINGVSGVDYEFFLVLGEPSALNYIGPVPEDSVGWARDRVLQGYRILKPLGMTPVAWNTPHYLASEADYQAFAGLYTYHCDSGVYFTRVIGMEPTRAMLQGGRGFRAGRAGETYFLTQIAPYPLWDIYNCFRIPETVGYLRLGPDDVLETTPADIIAWADTMQVVRDGWAGVYYHWFFGSSDLTQIIDGIEGLGYEFTGIPE